MKVFIIKSFSYRALNNKIKELVKSDNKINFDLEEVNLNDIIEEANYISLFNDEKYIIVRNMKYFSSRGEYEKENNIIEKYLNNENPNTTIIFICNDINLKNKNVKKIQENNNLIVINEYQKKDLDNEIINYLKLNNYKIDNKALDILKNKCINNYDIILNELDKLFLIKKDLYITIDDINNNVSNMLEDNYEFINAVITKKIAMFKHFDDLIELKVEPTIILGQIINQYKLIYFVKDAINYIPESEIATILKIHPYRVKLAKENGFNYSMNDLETIIDELIELDLKIKDDYQNKYQLIRVFLLNLINN